VKSASESVLLVIGTSGLVYPARKFTDDAISRGTKTVLFDISEWPDNPGFSEVVLGPAEETVPAYLSGIGVI
jgi:NAD-dependent SIR2 family protein deacetylase